MPDTFVLRPGRLLALLLALQFQLQLAASSPNGRGGSQAGTKSGSLPRSPSIPLHARKHRLPPWNPSTEIDPAGFLLGQYDRMPGEWEQEIRLRTAYNLDHPCRVRQVPGDGNCLFHSISLCLSHAINGTHWNLSSPSSTLVSHGGAAVEASAPPAFGLPTLDDLYVHSQKLRAQAVDCLLDGRRRLVLQGRESVRCAELVDIAAQQYGMSGAEYCQEMQQDSVWGGGPEIVALVNLLKRPIHVYELAVQNGRFCLRRMACFGSPRFDRQRALHILSADMRFPDLQPGQQNADGNHFLAVFPVDDQGDDSNPRRFKKRLLRGGDSLEVLEDLAMVDEDIVHEHRLLEKAKLSCVRWWNRAFGRLQ